MSSKTWLSLVDPNRREDSSHPKIEKNEVADKTQQIFFATKSSSSEPHPSKLHFILSQKSRCLSQGVVINPQLRIESPGQSGEEIQKWVTGFLATEDQSVVGVDL